jgi:hypothetical protein
MKNEEINTLDPVSAGILDFPKSEENKIPEILQPETNSIIGDTTEIDKTPAEEKKELPPLNAENVDIPTSTEQAPMTVEASDLISDNPTEKRGRGRPKGTKNKSSETVSEIPPVQQPTIANAENPQAIPQTDYKLLSSVIFDTTTNSLCMIFGPEWQPKDENEKNAVCGALANYLKAKEVKDIPPGVVLAIIAGSYASARIRQEPTKTKIIQCWLWIKSKIRRK